MTHSLRLGTERIPSRFFFIKATLGTSEWA